MQGRVWWFGVSLVMLGGCGESDPELVRGQQIWEGTCKVCHGPGLAGAPALGDADAWKPRIAQGQDVLTRHALTGFEGRAGQMPARGGNDALSDADVAAAVRYMVARSQ